jgi:hypothetical protein
MSGHRHEHPRGADTAMLAVEDRPIAHSRVGAVAIWGATRAFAAGPSRYATEPASLGTP